MSSIAEKIKCLDTPARVRLVFLALILVWCTYLSAGYAYEFSVPDNMKGAFLDVSDSKDVYVDGSDVTFAVVMLGMAGNLMLGVLFLIVFIIYFGIIFFASLIPVLLLRFVGLRKKYTVDEDEAYLARLMYFIFIGLSLVIGLILTRFTSVLPLVVYTAEWALVMLIYILGIRKRARENEGDSEAKNIL